MSFKVIPSVCTMFNLAAGIVSLISTIQEHYKLAVLFIVIAATFDVMDGLLARLLSCTSEFGKQLDSLADIVSFGVAPVILILEHNKNDSSFIGAAVGMVFIICGALRLARFNITPKSSTFTGMPITVAGFLAAGLSFFHNHIHFKVAVIILAVLSWLMISRIRFPSWKVVIVRVKGSVNLWK
ncbi:CDP-diacylglycerol--serine O-phosphatidyltransferase [Paenibacillus sp. HN-1]|uniref:CDP-diacylglycerol--serine O-phosphatidyltransferase n=1 Tax=Paenibacillus TaxID=44249 RepID=UPI001CA891C5|nr:MULTISPECIES: CDP-diacylglycerol--serine O-phosphatidyltransferase [Paenibacillus]MBY9079351.1 CDP-diacylglycerol--serine O-phosphatidyltransferase [Paenibacillus sp. CGMCC 1.18879]MBY9086462.1 CDP-diacylglycerol--serine O-phosphatidyltransferase [Paenibacillus sinensis]